MSSPTRVSRRSWLAGAAAAAVAGMWQVRQAAAQQPAGHVGLGLIGCGRRGRAIIEALAEVPGAALTALCDVSTDRATAAAAQAAGSGVMPTVYATHTELLADPAVTAVIIATPDQWHLLPFLDACHAGHDVYLEVPVATTIREGQVMIFATRKYKRVVQTGLHHRSAAAFEQVTALVRGGELGKVHSTRSWTLAEVPPVPETPDGEPPAGLDYDRWLGPAPMRPYNPARIERPWQWWDYGSGEASRWNVHHMDLLHWSLRVNVPRSVVAMGGRQGLGDFRETPDTLEALFEYQGLAGPSMHAHSLRLTPAASAPESRPTGEPVPQDQGPGNSGFSLIGAKGQLATDGLELVTRGDRLELPASRPAAAANAETAALVAHLANFVECVRSRREPRAPIETGHYASLAMHAANIAYRLGRRLYFHPQQQKFFADGDMTKPDEEANKMQDRTFRAPYAPKTV